MQWRHRRSLGVTHCSFLLSHLMDCTSIANTAEMYLFRVLSEVLKGLELVFAFLRPEQVLILNILLI